MNDLRRKYSNSFVVLNMCLTGMVLIAAKLTEFGLDFCNTLAHQWFPSLKPEDYIYVTAASLFFPFVYVTSSIFSDTYGYGPSRRNSLINYGINLVLVVVVALAGGSEVRILLGSLIGGLISVNVCDLLGDLLFQKLREKQKGNIKTFWLRSGISAILSDILDGAIFTVIMQKIAFGTSWKMIGICLVFYLPLKTIPKFILVPLAQLLTKKLRSIEGEEAFEPRSEVNLLGLKKK